MNSTSLLTQVTAPGEIHRYLDWHQKQDIPLLLMSGRGDCHRPARIVNFEPSEAAIHVLCSGFPDFSVDSEEPYALIGTTPSGANFLASGRMRAVAGAQDRFMLSLPDSIDVAQSRGSDRCQVPAGHLLHFCASDPHLNDVVCRVQNISNGGLAVLWERCPDNLPPVPDSLTDIAILQSTNQRVHLGKLQVAHVTSRKGGYIVGLKFEQSELGELHSLMRDMQRTPHFA